MTGFEWFCSQSDAIKIIISLAWCILAGIPLGVAFQDDMEALK